MHLDILTQIAVAIVMATTFGFLAKATRQPLILGYIAAGIIIGPTEGSAGSRPHDIEPIAELGLILLLFMIGLEIDLKKLRRPAEPWSRPASASSSICARSGSRCAAARLRSRRRQLRAAVPRRRRWRSRAR